MPQLSYRRAKPVPKTVPSFSEPRRFAEARTIGTFRRRCRPGSGGFAMRLRRAGLAAGRRCRVAEGRGLPGRTPPPDGRMPLVGEFSSELWPVCMHGRMKGTPVRIVPFGGAPTAFAPHGSASARGCFSGFFTGRPAKAWRVRFTDGGEKWNPGASWGGGFRRHLNDVGCRGHPGSAFPGGEYGPSGRDP